MAFSLTSGKYHASLSRRYRISEIFIAWNRNYFKCRRFCFISKIEGVNNSSLKLKGIFLKNKIEKPSKNVNV